MMKSLKSPLALLFLSLLCLISCYSREKELIRQGNELVDRIEEYKRKESKLPDGLEDIGIKESLEGPLFYEKTDSANYTVWFGTSLGEGMYYYSDTKEWDYRLR